MRSGRKQSGFEEDVEEYNRAVKEGVKKVYTLEEIKALLEKKRKKAFAQEFGEGL